RTDKPKFESELNRYVPFSLSGFLKKTTEILQNLLTNPAKWCIINVKTNQANRKQNKTNSPKRQK
ncbi:MAG: hypothetical protein IJD38_10480, partial [Clostridia bacterium]|nr:hypothetical protein [Clostridia bacterium]